MLKNIKSILAAAIVTAGAGLVVAAPMAYAVSPADSVNKGVQAVGGTGSSKTSASEVIALIVKIMLFIIGAISVIMIIVGGIRYTISQGDSTKLTTAKNTILYSVVGLLVALFSYAIVNFVVDNLGN